MAINFVGFSRVVDITGDSNTTITGALPDGGANGNLLVAFLASNANLNPNSYALPAGWNAIANNFANNGNFTQHVGFAWRIRTGDEALTWTIGADGRDDQLVIMEFSGDFDAETPITLFTPDLSGLFGVTFTSATLTPPVSDSLLVACCAAKNGDAAGAAYPAGMTGIFNERSRVLSVAVRSAAAYQPLATTDATGTRSWTNFVSSNLYGTPFAFIINASDAPAGPSVNPTGTDTTLAHGSTATIVFQNIVSNPVSVAVVYDDGVNSPVTSAQSDFALGTITDGAGSATFTATKGDLPFTDTTYPASNYSYLVTCADASTFTLSGITFNPAESNARVTAVDPVNDSTSVIPTWITGNASTGDQADHPVGVVSGGVAVGITVRPNFTHVYEIDEDASWPPSVNYEIGYWNSTTQTRYQIAVTVNLDANGNPVAGGITVRRIALHGISMGDITMRGLS